jgi:hypothetical protein
LATAIQTKYNTPPDATPTGDSVSVATSSVLASGTVSLTGTSSDPFVGGSEQAITITLNAADGYTFTGAQNAITLSDVVGAVLDTAVFTSGTVTGSVAVDDKTLTVTGIYTKPFSAAELAEQAAETLADALGSDASALGATVTLTGTATIDEDMDVANGVTLIVGLGGTLVIDANATISGTGVIKTENSGTIKIGNVAGYTTTSTGVVGDAFEGAADELVADMDKLNDVEAAIDLSTESFGTGNGIGTVKLATVDTAVTVKSNADPEAVGAAEITLNTATAFDGTITTTTVAGGISTGTFTLSKNTTDHKLGLAEGATLDGVTSTKGVVTFSNVKIKNSDLVSPELDAFNIGVATLRN